MSQFKHLLDEGRIEKVREDKSKAKGLLKRSKSRFRNQQNRNINQDTAFEILENIYESLREALEAGMSAEGYKSTDHVSTIAYAEEKLQLDNSQINKLHKFRKLRNESRYEAREITEKEAQDIKEFAENILQEIGEKVENKI